jgi:hypothetical protein
LFIPKLWNPRSRNFLLIDLIKVDCSKPLVILNFLSVLLAAESVLNLRVEKSSDQVLCSETEEARELYDTSQDLSVNVLRL